MGEGSWSPRRSTRVDLRARPPPHTKYVMSAPAQGSSWLRFSPVFSCWSLPLIDSSVLVYHGSAKLNGVLTAELAKRKPRCFFVLHKHYLTLEFCFTFTLCFMWTAVDLTSMYPIQNKYWNVIHMCLKCNDYTCDLNAYDSWVKYSLIVMHMICWGLGESYYLFYQSVLMFSFSLSI